MLGKKDYYNIKFVFCDAFGKTLAPDYYYKTKIVEIYEESSDNFDIKILQRIVVGNIVTLKELLNSNISLTLIDVDLQSDPNTRILLFKPYADSLTYARKLEETDIVVEDIEELLEYITKLKSKVDELNSSVNEVKKIMYKHTN